MCVPLGPICEQYLGVWESNVSHQPLCTVLLPACLHSDAHGHLTGQATGLWWDGAPIYRRNQSVLQSSAYVVCWKYKIEFMVRSRAKEQNLCKKRLKTNQPTNQPKTTKNTLLSAIFFKHTRTIKRHFWKISCPITRSFCKVHVRSFTHFSLIMKIQIKSLN